MNPSHPGSLHFFRFRGVDVFVHWMWFLVAGYQIQFRGSAYDSMIWNVWEYLALFGIVLLHEFGHTFACRQVGGTADRIVLWPLGGVAFVSPPTRPGAVLWSIAAGPLVNVALIPVLWIVGKLVADSALADTEWLQLAQTVAWINIALLIFNMLPVYPLDGGQILQSLLWFGIGRAKSLLVVTIIGAIAGVALVIYGLMDGDWWLALIGGFILMSCKAGFQQSRLIAKHEAAAR